MMERELSCGLRQFGFKANQVPAAQRIRHNSSVMGFNLLIPPLSQSLAVFRECLYWSMATIKLQIQFHPKKEQVGTFASKGAIA